MDNIINKLIIDIKNIVNDYLNEDSNATLEEITNYTILILNSINTGRCVYQII